MALSRTPAILLAVTLLLSLILLITGSQPVLAATENIRYVVRTADGSTPIKGAIVKLNGTGSTTTDESGQAVINANPKASNTVTVEFRGITVYNRIVNASEVDPSSPYVVPLNVNVSTMVIQVESETGVPVPRASLVLEYGASLTNNTTTDTSGRASLPLMPYTTYNVKVFYRGHAVGESPRAFTGGTLRITAGLHRLTVNVLDSSDPGAGVPSAIVRVWYGVKQSGNTTGFASGETDSGGVVRLDLLPDGNYYLEVEYKGENVFSSPSLIEISGAGRTYNAKTDLTRYSVTVYDMDGADVISGSQYRLSAELLRDSTRYSEASTTSGILSFGFVKPRTYTLVLKIGDNEVFRGPVSVPADTRVQARFYDIIVRVEAPKTPSEKLIGSVDITLQLGSVFTVSGTTRDYGISFNNVPGGRYSYEISRGPYVIGTGQVDVDSENKRITITPKLNTLILHILNADGEPISGRLFLSSSDGVDLGVVEAGDDGVVEVSGLIPISYRFYVEYRGIRVLDPQEIELRENIEDNLLTKVYNIVLDVYDSDGEKHLEGATIVLQAGNIVESNETGPTEGANFRNLPVGRYSISVEYLGIPVHSEEINVDASKTFKINAKSVVDAVLEVVDSESTPLESGEAEIVLGRARFSGEVSDGKVRFENIPAGSYRTTVTYLGFTVYDRPVAFSLDEDAVRVQVSVYYLTVEVKRADGTSLAGSQVKASTSNKLVGQAVTDAGGRSEIKLPKGDFTLDVFYQDTNVASQVVSVAQSGVVTVEAKVYRVEVRVITPDGQPVSGAEIKLSRDGKEITGGETDETGESVIYAAEGDYDWVTKIGEYTYSSIYKLRQNKALTLVHVIDNLQNQGIVLGATAAVSASSVVSLLRWGRPRARTPRQRSYGQRRPETPRPRETPRRIPRI
ncbi:hypothetical protein HRbin01_01191 [archaeon HR01]|nr:hypothetical protein HRbin01_01191 [archaeon HR01]